MDAARVERVESYLDSEIEATAATRHGYHARRESQWACLKIRSSERALADICLTTSHGRDTSIRHIADHNYLP